MLDANSLKAEMVRNGYTQEKMAKAIGITPRTFSTRLKTGDFGRKEMEIMIRLLNLKDPLAVFFGTTTT